MKVQIHSGKVVPKSGRGGAKPVPLYNTVEIIRDNSERGRYNESKYLPHQSEREIERRKRHAPKEAA